VKRFLNATTFRGDAHDGFRLLESQRYPKVLAFDLTGKKSAEQPQCLVKLQTTKGMATCETYRDGAGVLYVRKQVGDEFWWDMVEPACTQDVPEEYDDYEF
jgi:hypothetical protein